MTVPFNKFNQFVQDVSNKVHNLASDALYVGLTNTAPVATNSIWSNITELGAGNGYTAGGAAATQISCVQTSGVLKLLLNNPATWTAVTSTMGPFRYAVLYNSTPTTPLKPLIGWYDYGSAVTLAVGEQFQVTFDGVNGVFTIT